MYVFDNETLSKMSARLTWVLSKETSTCSNEVHVNWKFVSLFSEELLEPFSSIESLILPHLSDVVPFRGCQTSCSQGSRLKFKVIDTADFVAYPYSRYHSRVGFNRLPKVRRVSRSFSVNFTNTIIQTENPAEPTQSILLIPSSGRVIRHSKLPAGRDWNSTISVRTTGCFWTTSDPPQWRHLR